MINPNTGHGHVFHRPDGVKARCGGPGMCAECSQDLARSQKNGKAQGEVVATITCADCLGTCVEGVVEYTFPYGIAPDTVDLTVKHTGWRCIQCGTITTDYRGEQARSEAVIKHLQEQVRTMPVLLEALRNVSAALSDPFKGDMTKTSLDLGAEVKRRLEEA